MALEPRDCVSRIPRIRIGKYDDVAARGGNRAVQAGRFASSVRLDNQANALVSKERTMASVLSDDASDTTMT